MTLRHRAAGSPGPAPKSPARRQKRGCQKVPKPNLARFPDFKNLSSDVIFGGLRFSFPGYGGGQPTRLPSVPEVGRARAVFMVVGTAALRRPFPEPSILGGLVRISPGLGRLNDRRKEVRCWESVP